MRKKGYGYGPAAGASGGAAPRLADLKAPLFLRQEGDELHRIYHVEREVLAGYLYTLLLIHADFKTGELCTKYARLIELCTPPQPERGPRRPGPSMWDMRHAVDVLEGAGLVVRGEQNATQGQLRLFVRPRDRRSASDELARRKLRKVP